MSNLSNQTTVFKDSKGNSHDTAELATKASTQYLVNAVNAGSSVLSVDALATMCATNPEAWDYIQKNVEAKIKHQGGVGKQDEGVKEPHQPQNKRGQH